MRRHSAPPGSRGEPRSSAAIPDGGVLVAVVAVMYAVASPYYGRMRAGAGISGYGEKANDYRPPAKRGDLDGLATSRRPEVLAAVGGVGLGVIIWLMVVKPF